MNPGGLLELLRARRSVRRFRPEPIDPAVVRRLLDAARLAPSAHNRQPWRFAVVSDFERRTRLAQAMADRLRRDRSEDAVPAERVEAEAGRSIERLTSAPCVIVVCLSMADMDSYPDTRRSKAEFLMAVQSVAMAGANLLLAASADGLGGCWMCAPLFAGEEARQALDLPHDWEPQGVILLGEPADSPAPRGRRSVDQVTRWA